MKMWILYIIAILSTISCERRELEEAFEDTAKIPVSIDWSLTNLDPTTDTENLYRATVYMFARSGTSFNGASYKEYKLSNATYDEISVPMGEYSVVVFNNSTTEFSSNVGFRGLDSYNDFEYYANNDETRTRADEDNYKLEPDILGAWQMDNFTVTSDMVLVSRASSSTRSSSTTKAEEDLTQLTGVQPQRLTQTITIKVYATNISSAVSASGKLIGIAHSVKLASSATSDEGASQGFSFESRTYDSGSSKNGYIEATFETMGTIDNKDGEYYLEVRFLLSEEYDGSYYYPAENKDPFRFNVTNQLQLQQGSLILELDLGFDEDEGDDMSLPQLNISGGFEPDIGDWGDEEWVEI